MGEFFASEAGAVFKEASSKTNKLFQGQSIFRVEEKIYNLKKGDYYYLDALHKDHLEVFDNTGRFKFSLNLDGTVNLGKTSKGLGRSIDV